MSIEFDYNIHKTKIYDPLKIVVVSYFTSHNFYKDEAKYLAYSLEKLKINYVIYAIHIKNIKSVNNFDNCKFSDFGKIKPFILKIELQKWNRILWVDCDAMLFKYPDEIENIKLDIGICSRREDKLKITSSIIFFRKTDDILKLLNKWYDQSFNDGKGQNDQVNLQNIILQDNIKYHNITKNQYITKYRRIRANPKTDCYNYTAIQFMASNRSKALEDKDDDKYQDLKNQIFKCRDSIYDLSKFDW